jgi:hypothetical protein
MPAGNQRFPLPCGPAADQRWVGLGLGHKLNRRLLSFATRHWIGRRDAGATGHERTWNPLVAGGAC